MTSRSGFTTAAQPDAGCASCYEELVLPEIFFTDWHLS